MDADLVNGIPPTPRGLLWMIGSRSAEKPLLSLQRFQNENAKLPSREDQRRRLIRRNETSRRDDEEGSGAGVEPGIKARAVVISLSYEPGFSMVCSHDLIGDLTGAARGIFTIHVKGAPTESEFG